MIRRNADSILNHLEKESSDELSYLVQVGANYFSTAQLLRLRGQWEIKNELFWRFQKILLRVVASSPLWLLSWFVFDFFQWKWLSLLCLAICPLSFFVFFAGLIFMKNFFKGKGHLEMVGEMIYQELQHRRLKDQEIE